MTAEIMWKLERVKGDGVTSLELSPHRLVDGEWKPIDTIYADVDMDPTLVTIHPDPEEFFWQQAEAYLGTLVRAAVRFQEDGVQP